MLNSALNLAAWRVISIGLGGARKYAAHRDPHAAANYQASTPNTTRTSPITPAGATLRAEPAVMYVGRADAGPYGVLPAAPECAVLVSFPEASGSLSPAPVVDATG